MIQQNFPSSTHPRSNGSFCSFMLCSRDPASWSVVAWLGLYPVPDAVTQSSIARTEVIGESLPHEEVFEEARGLKSGLSWKPPELRAMYLVT